VTEALTRREKLYGHVHASVAASEVVRGQIQLANGEPIPAEATYRDALAILPRTLGSEHPDVGVALRGLAEALIAQNRDAEARPLAERALELQRRKLRPGHPEIAATLAVLATLADRAAPGSGESLFRKALEIARGALRKEHPHIMRLESQLGASLALQPRDGEGALLLRSAADQLSKELGDAHFETRRARQRCASASVPCPVESPAARSRRE
jgi:tetratricopeptide (TPR) repeat protein